MAKNINVKFIIFFLFFVICSNDLFSGSINSSLTIANEVVFDDGYVYYNGLSFLKQKNKDRYWQISAGLSYWFTKKIIAGIFVPYNISNFQKAKNVKGFGDINLSLGYKFYQSKILKCIYSFGIDIPTASLCSENIFSSSALALDQALTISFFPNKFYFYNSSYFSFYVPRKFVQRGSVFNSTTFLGYRLFSKNNFDLYGLAFAFFYFADKDKCKMNNSFNCPFTCLPRSTYFLIGPSLYLQVKNFYTQLVFGFPIVNETVKSLKVDSLISLSFAYNF